MRTRDKRYKGDWLPKDKTAERKGRVRRRHVMPKSEWQKASERQARDDKAKIADRKTIKEAF
jgi:hypothetical protein